MTYKEKLEKLHDYVQKKEDYFYKPIEEGKHTPGTLAALQCMFQATSYQDVRYKIEDLLEDCGKMSFNEAYSLMKKGAKIRLPEWKGYWYWSEEKNTIIIHTKDNIDLDIRECEDVGFTMSNICRDDWEEVE